ncbi:MAG: type II toxin-antitoxin system HicA family toxin [bacterium]|nr:type II toxin-antitoxin system HicA family toxin [bacterium]
MPKIPPLKAKKIIKVFLKEGFYVHHQAGSHVHLRHLSKKHLRVTIPRHDKFELPPFIVNSILTQSEITKEQFLKLFKK